MIGNDIIDLQLARKQSNWQRKGFVGKLFTVDEQVMISNTKNSERLLWELWSRKEAAYKIYNRQTGIRGFIPKQLICSDAEKIGDKFWGKVTIGPFLYFTKTIINGDFIHTIAVTTLENFKKIRFVERQDISKNSEGIPFHTLSKNPVTISHHGRFEERLWLDMNVEP